MIITKFNSYFDKHGKVTYLVLCIIIAVIFVFTIGSGDSGCSGQERLTSIGSMYGHNLAVDDIQRKSAQLRLFYAMNNQQLPNSVGDFEQIQMVLENMRLVRAAEDRKLDEITDEDMASAIVAFPYWQASDKDHSGNELDSTETGFSQKRFKGFLSTVVKGRFGLSGEDFDEMVKDSILTRRVLDDEVKGIKADEKKVKLLAAESDVQVATYPMNLERDSRPSEKEIDDFMKNRSKELTAKDRMENFFLIAYRDYDSLLNDSALSKDVKATEAEVQAYFKAHADKLYKGKKLSDVKAEVEKAASRPKCQKWIDGKMKAFVAELKKPVAAGSNRFVQFQAAARRNKLSLARQNGLPLGSFVSGIPMQQRALVNALKAIKSLNVATPVVELQGEMAVNGQAVAMKVDNPTKKLHMRNAAADILRGEKALVLFQEKIVKPYGGSVSTVKSLEEFIGKQLKLTGTETLSNPESYVNLVNDIDRLNNVVFPFFKEENGKVTLPTPAKTDPVLLNWYKREVALEKAKARAEAALKTMTASLKSGKTLAQADVDKRFVKAKKPVEWQSAMERAMQMTYQQMMMTRKPLTPMLQNNILFYSFSMVANDMGVAVKNLPALISVLDKTGDKALLPYAFKGTSGYVLVYQDKRALPVTEEGKKKVSTATSMVENELKSKAISALKAKLETESNTRLVEEVMPHEAEPAKK